MGASDAALRLLGLAARAGSVVPGTERVREAVRSGTAHLVIVAEDVSENSREKLVPLLEARGVKYVTRFTRDELGGAIGKSPMSALALTNASLAKKIRSELGAE